MPTALDSKATPVLDQNLEDFCNFCRVSRLNSACRTDLLLLCVPDREVVCVRVVDSVVADGQLDGSALSWLDLSKFSLKGGRPPTACSQPAEMKDVFSCAQTVALAKIEKATLVKKTMLAAQTKRCSVGGV